MLREVITNQNDIKQKFFNLMISQMKINKSSVY